MYLCLIFTIKRAGKCISIPAEFQKKNQKLRMHVLNILNFYCKPPCPAVICMLTVNKRNTRERYETCLKLAIFRFLSY